MTDSSMLRRVIELHTWLDEVCRRLPLAEVNLVQAVREFSSCTPGNGSPGAGKGASSATIRVQGDVVPVTGVEAMVLGARDIAAVELARLSSDVVAVDARVATLVADVFGQLPRMPTPAASSRARVRHARSAALLVKARAETGVFPSSAAVAAAHTAVGRLHRLVMAWSFTPAKPKMTREQTVALAPDPTGSRCESHLRVGARVDRTRGPLCDWCYRLTLMVPTWTAPPPELVQLHADQGKVYAHQLDPFLRAERDRVRQKRRARR